VPTLFAEGKQNDVVSLTGVNAGELRGIAGSQEGPVTVEAYRQDANKRSVTELTSFSSCIRPRRTAKSNPPCRKALATAI